MMEFSNYTNRQYKFSGITFAGNHRNFRFDADNDLEADAHAAGLFTEEYKKGELNYVFEHQNYALFFEDQRPVLYGPRTPSLENDKWKEFPRHEIKLKDLRGGNKFIRCRRNGHYLLKVEKRGSEEEVANLPIRKFARNSQMYPESFCFEEMALKILKKP